MFLAITTGETIGIRMLSKYIVFYNENNKQVAHIFFSTRLILHKLQELANRRIHRQIVYGVDEVRMDQRED